MRQHANVGVKRNAGVWGILGIVVIFLITSFVGCSSSSKESESYSLVQDGTLTVGIDLSYEPYEGIDGMSSVAFDRAVAIEVASRLGLSCQFIDASRSVVMDGLARHQQFDVGASCLVIGDKAYDKADFTDPYILVDQAIVVRAGTGLIPGDATGLDVAAPVGSPSLAYAQTLGGSVTPCLNVRACADMLRATHNEDDGIQAIVVDLPAAQKIVASDPSLVILEQVSTGQEIGLAVSKSQPVLTSALNDVLASMDADGTLAVLRAQYVG